MLSKNGSEFASMSTAAMTETIIIYRLGSIGDTVIALPCFHRIARSFPNKRRIVLTNRPISTKAAPLASVLEHSGLIHGTLDYEVGERRIKSLARIRDEVRSNKVKTLVYLTEPRGRSRLIRDILFFRFCGIRNIIGAPISFDFYHLRRDPTTGMVEREAERLSRCISELGSVDIANKDSWDLKLTETEIRSAQAALVPLQGRKFAAVNIGGKVITKDWGDDNWAACLRLLWSKIPGIGLAFFGAAEEEKRNSLVAKYWPGASINLCGRLSPRQSAAAMKFSRMFLGHDSGPMHLAASVGIPCVALFGNYNQPKKWHPLGNHHRILHNMAGIGAILPEQVVAAVCEVLKNEFREVGTGP